MSEIPNELQPVETEPAPAPPPHKPFWLDVHAWLRDIFLSVALAAIVIVFLYQPVKVEGTSMLPWLQDQQRIFVNKFVYSYGEIERGDVIVFRFPLDPSKSYIKRVVGVPGDHVEIVAGELFINGDMVDESYVAPEFEDHSSHPPIDVPEGHFYVLGDHRNTSNDSRIWGTVPREFVTGKAVFAYWPLDRFGSLR
ncbi:MAG: signal peptidase I [Bryobacterales bacterium]|nr:signal peptidase I [Acidobacteriota bacterium]MCB9385776.1 signal peptidase I [Bryobacterales bacterium]